MYIPSFNREDRLEQIHAFMAAYPLATLVTSSPEGLLASPIPLVIYPQEGTHGILRAHLARANSHWKALEQASEVMVLFHGPQGYVSPSWYPSKQEDPRTVPTWNYVAVHVRGSIQVTHDPAWLWRQIDDLTRLHEGARPQPWALSDAPTEYLNTQVKAIVGLELTITQLEGKYKLSQNRSQADQQGVVAGMANPHDPHHNPPVSDLMAQRKST